MTVNNLLAVLLGDKKTLKGGSGKVVNSGPNDHIFIYYSDHGGPGVLGGLLCPTFLTFVLFKVSVLDKFPLSQGLRSAFSLLFILCCSFC